MSSSSSETMAPFKVTNCSTGAAKPKSPSSRSSSSFPTQTPPQGSTMFPVHPSSAFTRNTTDPYYGSSRGAPTEQSRIEASKWAVNEDRRERQLLFIYNGESGSRLTHQASPASHHDQVIAAKLLLQEAWFHRGERNWRSNDVKNAEHQAELDAAARQTMKKLWADVDILMNSPVWKDPRFNQQQTTQKLQLNQGKQHHQKHVAANDVGHPYLFTIREISKLNLFSRQGALQ